MTTMIGQSVGRNGANVSSDVKAVAAALNPLATSLGVPKVRVDGTVDAGFIAAIEAFQSKTMNIASPDGRIDPGGKTLKALGAAVPSPAPAPPAAPSLALPATIAKSVGRSAVNASADVKIVAQLLNKAMAALGLAPVRTDGTADGPLLAAIDTVQSRIMKRASPDGRIDPGGQTLATLNNVAAHGLPAPTPSPTPAATPTPTPTPTTTAPRVTYSQSIPDELRLVSDYGFAVVRKALARAGMTAGVITSTLRLPFQQAGIMYDNALIDLDRQYQLYASAGDKVLDVFKANRGKPRAGVIALMQARIDALLDQGIRVSNHVVRLSDYAKCNVIDIGMNSTSAAAGSSFNRAGLTRAFAQLADEGYIRKFIDETDKSNRCWHIEVVPGARPI